MVILSWILYANHVFMCGVIGLIIGLNNTVRNYWIDQGTNGLVKIKKVWPKIPMLGSVYS